MDLGEVLGVQKVLEVQTDIPMAVDIDKAAAAVASCACRDAREDMSYEDMADREDAPAGNRKDSLLSNGERRMQSSKELASFWQLMTSLQPLLKTLKPLTSTSFEQSMM